jgi:ABC-type transport system involved in cytochrome bd biosynthesis fused ATPase/permease subunit
VVGETGSGKSSFLELLAGVTTPKGTVLIGGDDVTDVSYRSVTNALFYGPQAARFLSGPFLRAVLFDLVPANASSLPRLLEHTRLKSVAGLLNAEEFPVSRLSGGERKRLALLRALTYLRPIIVLDEPTGDLDADVASSVWSTIFELTCNHTLICATHDLTKLDQFDQIIRVSGGTVTVVGTPENTDGQSQSAAE